MLGWVQSGEGAGGGSVRMGATASQEGLEGEELGWVQSGEGLVG